MADPIYSMTPEQIAALQKQLSGLDLMRSGEYTMGGGLNRLSTNGPASYAVPENYGNPKNKVYQLSAQTPAEKIRLVGLDGTVYYEGTGDTGAKEAAALIQTLGKEFGPGATWKLQKQIPGVDPNWNTVSQDTVGKQKTTALNAFLDVAAPIAGAFIPGLGALLGPALGAAAGAGLGSIANSAFQNKNSAVALKDAAISAATAGATAGIGNALSGAAAKTAAETAAKAGTNAVTSAATNATAGGLGNAVGNTIAHLPGDFVITAATRPLTDAITNAALKAGALGLTGESIKSALNSSLKSGLSDLGTQPTTPPVEAAPTTPPNTTPLDAAANTTPPIDELVVTAPSKVPISPAVPAVAGGLTLASLFGGNGASAATNAITNTNTSETLSPDTKGALDASNANLTGDGASLTGESVGKATDALTSGFTTEGLTPEVLAALDEAGVNLTAAAGSGGLTAAKLLEYLKTHPLEAAGLIGGLAGGGTSTGGSGATGTVNYAPGTRPGEVGSLPASFREPLPAPTGIFANMKPRDMSGTNFATYGQGPEQSFFENTPVRGLAHGGSSNGPRKEFAVRGAGTGRSDDIPAVLSDGEYVMDAETVALLGDGSSKAGADKLDEFRVNLRKHKGQNLAKGRFSVNAKAPEKYLSGGHT